ncbi:MAG: hypothetical protein LIP09_04710 [Bacteroidales bacterium]|nr:hypothetical protein [Bacteroidales bacterium]
MRFFGRSVASGTYFSILTLIAEGKNTRAEIDKRVEFIEVKRQEKNIDMSILRAKAEVCCNAVGQYKKYKISYRGLSLEDIRAIR